MALAPDRSSIRLRDGVLSLIESALGAALRLAKTPAVARTALLLDGNLGVRSRLRNGNFTVNQRGVSGTVTLAAGSSFGHDGWKGGSASGGTYTFAKTNGITTLTISAGTVRQVIEGIHLPEAGVYTLAWEGTAPARIVQNGVVLADYGPSPRTAVLASEINATVEFGIGTLALPRFVPGTVAALFEHRDDEMRRCQRYAQVLRDKQNVGGPARNGSSVVTSFQLPVEMRATPALSILTAGDWWVSDGYSNDWQANPVSLVFQSLTPTGGTIALDGFTTPSTLFVGRFHLPSASQGTARLLLSADI